MCAVRFNLVHCVWSLTELLFDIPIEREMFCMFYFFNPVQSVWNHSQDWTIFLHHLSTGWTSWDEQLIAKCVSGYFMLPLPPAHSGEFSLLIIHEIIFHKLLKYFTSPGETRRLRVLDKVWNTLVYQNANLKVIKCSFCLYRVKSVPSCRHL